VVLLTDQVALITGGARGQGRAHAVTCAREGADVILFDLPEPLKTMPYEMATERDMAETVAQVEALDRRALVVKGDVRSQSDLDDAVTKGIAEFGKICILIANAGIWASGPFWQLSEEEWNETIDVDLSGVWRSAKAVAPHMIERRAGSIVITASINGIEPGEPFSHYVAAKHGVLGLMKSIALELGPYGIRCNAVSPGPVDTPMTDQQAVWDWVAGHDGATRDDMIEAGHHFNVLKGTTFLPAQAIADAALYLNSNLASVATGVTLPVDAGHLLLSGYNHAPVH
jgi:SDR family mycofactocin-dependent oxidoreductase